MIQVLLGKFYGLTIILTFSSKSQKTDTEFFTKEDKSPTELKHFFPKNRLHKRLSVDVIY